jgi:hypothetical protein
MGEKKKLKDVLKNQAMKKALVTVVIEGNSDRAQREVECELCAASLQVPGPSRSKKKRDKTLNLNCVWVQEKKESDDEKLEWILWTNEPIETEENVIKVLQYYRLRPLIEEFHKILKSGLKVEDCCLGSADKFARFLALKSILAWRLFLICRVGRHNGDLSCEVVFSRMEWQILWVRRKKTKPPQEPPTLQEAIILLACLGGYPNRKNDGPPGITVIWRGWHRLCEGVETYASIQAVNGLV